MMHCGMEIVLPSGELIRTAWVHFRILLVPTLMASDLIKFLGIARGNFSIMGLDLTMMVSSLRAI
jgi:hypothetical protein